MTKNDQKSQKHQKMKKKQQFTTNKCQKMPKNVKK